MKFYRDQAKNLPAPGPWADEAKQWWKDNHPALYRQFRRAGQLDNEARVAEANAKDLYADLVSQGFDPRGAEEIAKATFITPERDSPETTEDREAGEQMQVAEGQ